MIQPGDPERGVTDPPLRFRDRHRLARHREFVEAARQIVTTEGSAALTMQRVTDAVGSSTGGIYVYFSSKDALIAELQREAMTRLRNSLVLGQERLDRFLEEIEADPTDAALARVLATGHFWIAAEEYFSTEVTLIRSFLTPEGRKDLSDDERANGMLSAAVELLQEVAELCAAAIEADALTEGQNIERALVLMSSVLVVLLISTLSRWDETILDGRRLAAELIRDLVGGWGAPPERLSAAEALVNSFLADHTLAPAAGEE